MDKYSHFKIIDNDTYYTIENVKANDFDNFHTHINKKSNKPSKRNKKDRKKDSLCSMLIRLICRKQVPKSDYLRESAKRISRDEKYIQDIDNKIEKDRDRQKYVRSNMGKFN